jgi:4-oxalocrotonate tautomerase
MPLIRISLRAGTSASYRRAIATNVYEALRETFNVPERDFFVTISEHTEDQFFFDDRYMDIERSAKLVYLQLTVSNTRTVAQKQALYRRIVERLAKDPGLRPQDVFINLVEVAKENWSFGNGDAQYATPSAAPEPVAGVHQPAATAVAMAISASLLLAIFTLPLVDRLARLLAG